MTKSNKMSTMSELTTLALVLSKLSKAQVFASGDQTERSYSCQISTKIVDVEIFTCVIPVISPNLIRDYSIKRTKYLPWMRSEMSATHIAIAIAIMILFIFQMAILPSFLNYVASGG